LLFGELLLVEDHRLEIALIPPENQRSTFSFQSQITFSLQKEQTLSAFKQSFIYHSIFNKEAEYDVRRV